MAAIGSSRRGEAAHIPPRGGRGLPRDCTLGQSKGLKQSETAGDAQPLELSVCMLHTLGELGTLRPPCSSTSSAMFSRLMSVAMDCTTLTLLAALALGSQKGILMAGRPAAAVILHLQRHFSRLMSVAIDCTIPAILSPRSAES